MKESSIALNGTPGYDGNKNAEISAKLKTLIETINRNYKVEFVIEKTTYDSRRVEYYLKRKRVTKLFHLRWEALEYETSNLSYKIAFKSLEEVELYLMMQYSEPQGFKTSSVDFDMIE